MNKCPYCGVRASIVGLMTMTRRRPYRCNGCGKRSLLQPQHNTVTALLMLASVFFCALVVVPRAGFGLAIATFGGLYIAVGLVMLVGMKLAPVES